MIDKDWDRRLMIGLAMRGAKPNATAIKGNMYIGRDILDLPDKSEISGSFESCAVCKSAFCSVYHQPGVL